MNACPLPRSSFSSSGHRNPFYTVAYGLSLIGLSLLWLLLTTAPAAANSPPTIISSPVVTATLDSVYNYTITTSDPDIGDTLTLSALTKPGWLILTLSGDASGILSGRPAPADTGVSSVILEVRDAGGLTAVQAFSVTVMTEPWPQGSMAGKVTVAGVGIAGVLVRLSFHCDGMVILCPAALIDTITDAEGNFHFDSLLIGTYSFYVEPIPDFEVLEPLEFVVKADQVTIVPEIALTPTWSGQLFLPHLVQ